MTVEKWRFLMGQVFQLDRIYKTSPDAFRRAKELRKENRVHLARTVDGKWALYWRPKEQTVECEPSHYKVA
ncbi:MAG: hypothetical protein ACTSUO_09200 [Candidatus Thorarchaeota archaeon]